VFNFASGWVFINIISEAAISLTALVLRGQAVGNARAEQSIHQTKKDTKADLKKSDEVLAKLDKA
jgi:hypothetical protein